MEKYLNKITCGDSYKLIKEIADNSIDLIVTDPPYGIGIEKMCFTKGGDKIYNSKAKRNDYSSIGNWDSCRVGGV